MNVDAKTGDIQSLYAGGVARPEWSPDGRHVYFCSDALIEVDVVAQTERVVAKVDCSGNRFVNVSPDGRWVATREGSRGIVLIAPRTGETRTLITLDLPNTWHPGFGWTPDGQAVIARRVRPVPSEQPTQSELLAVPLDGSQPRKLDVDVNAAGPLTTFRVHPDGKRLAFFTSVDRANEVWVVENFLSSLSPKRVK